MKDQAVSACSASFKLHSIKAPSIVNFENGDSDVAACSAAKNCESAGLFRKKRIINQWLMQEVITDILEAAAKRLLTSVPGTQIIAAVRGFTTCAGAFQTAPPPAAGAAAAASATLSRRRMASGRRAPPPCRQPTALDRTGFY